MESIRNSAAVKKNYLAHLRDTLSSEKRGNSMCSVLSFIWGEQRIYVYTFIKAQNISERIHKKL